MTLSILNNFNLLIVGVTIAAIGILGFIIFYSNPKSVTNRSFLLFSLMTIVYGILNYLNYQVSSPLVILWLLRLVIFSAVWHAFSLFKLLYVFPQEKFDFPKEYKYYLVPIVVITSLFNLSPWVFSRIDILGTTGQVSKTQVEGGIILFILVILCLTIGGLYYLFKKTLHASTYLFINLDEAKRIQHIAVGVLLRERLIRSGKNVEQAKEQGIEIIATTLTIGRNKRPEIINLIGKAVAEKYGVKFYEVNFKKQDGALKGSVICKKYNLYRQHYCGCEYSL